MIKATTKGPLGNHNGVVLGLSRENTRRLHEGKPIVVHLRELHDSMPDMAVVLLAGETEDDLVEDLRVLAPIRQLTDERQDG